ncbi:hypothetical protein [Erythrobacter aureus]|uniref:Uncharacterized protein n=1 Tax=Erythrobacter aureus TaxID=2182384 RepID=A0A345YEH4_9SPHN|nr:hypothetical protein [Erythrobacter aureus]AXK42326.1 hypothetical protein DVR09_08230 [Erythrobacter aureus]
MTEPLLIAIFGILSAALGGVIHALFQRWQKKGDDLLEQKVAAYAAYFNGIAQLSHASNEAEIAKSNAIVAEARGRVALYGSTEVLEAMTAAFHCGPIRDEDYRIHARVVRAMRKDADLASGSPSDTVLFEMLFGTNDKRI